MNKERRKDLEKVKEEAISLGAKINDLRTAIDGLKDEEQDYLDNMPEGLQSGEKGEQAQAAITAMGDAEGALDEVCSKIDEAME